MKVEISSSQRDEIDNKYKESVDKLCKYLTSKNVSLVWGSGVRSIMGICYNNFAEKDLPIYGYTSPKWIDEIDDLPKAKHVVLEDTFLLRREMFNSSDMVIMVPGGTGTIAEFFSFLEEMRSNDALKYFVVFDEYGHFDMAFKLIDDLIERNFNSKSIYDYIKVFKNLDDFKMYFEKVCKKHE